jgi:hypothetical protein
MCLPFCCRENDPPQPQVTHEHHQGHGVGVGHTEPVDHHPPSSGTGKESDNGNGANKNKNKSDDKDKNKNKNKSDAEDTEEVPSPTLEAPQAPPSPKHRGQETEEASVAAAGVADSARTPPETQQIARRGHAHDEDDYGYSNPSASPTVVAVPAANNLFRGDRGHGDAHADSGKDDRKTPGRTWW